MVEDAIGKIMVAAVIIISAYISISWLIDKATKSASQLVDRAAVEAKKLIVQGESALKNSATHTAKEFKSAIEPSASTIAAAIILAALLKIFERRDSR